MQTIRAPKPLSEPGRKVLADAPVRVVTFLRAIGSRGDLQAAMARGGFAECDHREGLELLAAACAFEPAADPDAQSPARAAMEQIAEWVARHVPRLEAAVARLHPETAGLFDGIHPGDGAAAPLALAMLLDRLSALAPSAPVLETLARRRLDASERQRLAKLLAIAQSSEPAARSTTHDRSRALLALYRWHNDWATTAHRVIERREQLIALGLADRGRRARVEAPRDAVPASRRAG